MLICEFIYGVLRGGCGKLHHKAPTTPTPPLYARGEAQPHFSNFLFFDFYIFRGVCDICVLVAKA